MQGVKPYSYYLGMMAVLLPVAFLFPIGHDWSIYSTTLEQIQAPYDISGFIGMPFAFFVLPHSLLPVDIGAAINLALSIMVIIAVARRYAGRQWHIAFAITMTSPLAINMIQSNNIDWLPLSSFLVADWLAYPLLAIKPQVLAGAAIIRFKRNPKPLSLIPLLIMLIASVLIWGDWWTHLGRGGNFESWNFAPFPYMIPVGVYLLWVGWKRDDEIIAACATPFFVPYFAPYSLVGLHVLLASRHRQAAIGLWVATWWYLIITAKLLGGY